MFGKIQVPAPGPGTSGTILIDETDPPETIIYDFEATVFNVNDPVSFDIDPATGKAINVKLVTAAPSSRDVTGPSGGFTVQPNETVTVKNGGVVTGDITVNAGKLIIGNGGQHTGVLTIINGGSAIIRGTGNRTGTVDGQDGTTLKVVNGGTSSGDVSITKASHLIIGNANGGGKVNGAITIQKIRKVIITATSKVNCP